ncbi:MAG: hypothetical protein KDC80_00860 [Saprospiraceae bacterium]|nr:hypothetical protein [Saprospiraceae bacterium]
MRTTFIHLILTCMLMPVLYGQEDLYSYEATRQFANYLFLKGDFDFASEEYARLLFLKPGNDSIRVRLSQSYRKQEKFALASEVFAGRETDLKSDWVENEYIATLLFQKDSFAFNRGLNQVKYLSSAEVQRKKVEFAMLQRQWKSASAILISTGGDRPDWTNQYQQTIDRAQAFRPKKPWLAATYSAIIPGSGKMYAHNVKEGVTSLFFVAALGYQSYRAFHKRGSKAVSGWIYGGLGLGFYLGNIYGAHQSAKNYNKRQLDSIYHEVDQNIMSRY